MAAKTSKSLESVPADNFFAKVAGEDMEVDAKELQAVLNHALKKGESERGGEPGPGQCEQCQQN